MTRISILFALLFACSGNVFTQAPDRYEVLAKYNMADDLMGREKYGAARQQFVQFIDESNRLPLSERPFDLLPLAMFNKSVCSFNLLRNNAESEFMEFVTLFSTHPKVNESWYFMGKMHYIKRNYLDAIPTLKMVDINVMNKDQADETMFMLGWSFYARKMTANAETVFKTLKNREGEYSENAAYYYSVIKYEEENFSEAYKGFMSIKSDGKLMQDVPIYIANCLLKLELFEELDYLAEEVKAGKKSVNKDFYQIMANAAYERGEYQEAVDFFDEYAKKRGMLDRSGRYRKGFSYFQIKDYKNAQEEFEGLTYQEDDIAQNASYYLGHCFLERDENEKARLAFGKAQRIGENPDVVRESLFNYAKISFKTKYYNDALIAFQKLIKNYPDYDEIGEVKALVGEILLYSGKYKEAIEYFEKSPLKTERSRKAFQVASYNYGQDLYNKGIYNKAADYFKKSFNNKFDADLTMDSYFWYAEAKYSAKDYDEAITYYNRFLDQPYSSKHDYYSRAYFGIAWSDFMQKKYKEAGKNFSKFINIADKNKEADLVLHAYLRAGDCEFMNQKYQNALNYYTEVINLNSKAVDYALYQVGQCDQREGNYDSAIRKYKELIENHRQSQFRDDALVRTAELYANFLEDWSNCSRYAKMLIDDYPKNRLVADAHILIGTAAYNLDDEERAIQNFKIVALEYADDQKNSIVALDNLNSLVEGAEYDRVYAAWKKKNPGTNAEVCDLQLRTATDRFYGEKYETAISQLTDFIRDCGKGERKYEALFYRGQSNEKMGDIDQALDDYAQVYNATPANAFSQEALKMAADLQHDQKRYLSSLRLFETMEKNAENVEGRMTALFGKAMNYMAMEDYKLAEEVYMGIYTNPNSTEYSRNRANVKIASCKYYLGYLDEAYSIFSEIEKEFSNAFAAESQYMITRILYDRKKFSQSRDAGLYLKDNYSTQHYWMAKAFLVVAEDYLELGDTFQCKGNLDLLATEVRFKDVQQAAIDRLEELKRLESERNRQRSNSSGEVDDFIEVIQEKKNKNKNEYE